MPVDPLPSDKLIIGLKKLFLYLLIGQFVIGAVACFILYTGSAPVQDFSFGNSTEVTIILVIAALLIIAGIVVPRKMLVTLRGEKDDTRLYAGYRKVVSIRWALHEAATLICLVSGYRMREPELLCAALIAFLIFCSLYPSRDKMFSELRLGFRY